MKTAASVAQTGSPPVLSGNFFCLLLCAWFSLNLVLSPCCLAAALSDPLNQAEKLAAQGDYVRASTLLVQHFEQMGSDQPEKQVLLLLQLADYQFRLSQPQSSLQMLKQALGIANRHHLVQTSARTQYQIAVLLHQLGHSQAALDAAQAARNLYLQVKSNQKTTDNALARSLLLIARIYADQGRYQPAVAAANQSLSATDHNNDPAFLVEQMLTMGDVMFLNGAFAAKERYLEMALQFARSAHSPVLEAQALAELGELYNFWGKTDQALIHLQAAIKSAAQADVTLMRKLLLLQAEIHLNLRQLQLAQADFAMVRKTLPDEKDLFLQAGMKLRLGQGAAALGQTELAGDDFKDALQTYERLQMPFRSAQVIYALAELDRQQGHSAQAIDFYQKALQDVSSEQDPLSKMLFWGGLGQSQLQLGQTDHAIQSLESAVAAARQVYASTADAVKLEAFDKWLPLYQALIRAYFQTHQIDKALNLLEDSRGLAFLSHFAVNAQRQRNSGQTVWKGWAEGLIPGSLALIYTQPESANMLQFRVRLNQDPISSQWQEKVQDGLALASQNLILASSVYQTQSQLLHLPRDGSPLLPALCQAYRQLLSQPQSDPALLKAVSQLLYQVLIAPHEASLRGIKTLLIAPEGELGLIPFETLRNPAGEYLVERFDIQYIQSVRILGEIESREYGPGRKPMLVFGNPVYQPLHYEREPVENPQQLLELKKLIALYPDGNMREAYGALYSPVWEPLNGTQSEVAGIQKAIPGSVLLTGEQADETLIKTMSQKGELADYRVLHFASHGLAVPEIPELSALVLSQFTQMRGEDGYLRMPEIEQLRLRADFVNLSACETGLGKIFKGEGVVGLAQAFLSAGANQVAVSLWQINDQSSAKLMTALYQQAGHNYAHNLNEAKRQFIQGKFGKTYRHPYYWSPFLVFGRLQP